MSKNILANVLSGMNPKWQDGILMLGNDQLNNSGSTIALSIHKKIHSCLGSDIVKAICEYSNVGEKGNIWESLFNRSGGALLSVCPVNRQSVILHIGCGLGATSRSFTNSCSYVLGMDISFEKLAINQLVCKYLGIENIDLIHGNHNAISEFRDSSIDGIVINGILPKIMPNGSKNPEQIQTDFLKECRRILKGDGWLFLGAENRLAYSYFLGQREAHTGLRFVTLLPRILANYYCRTSNGKTSHSYTSSPAGYRRMLWNAGFQNLSTFATVPNHKKFQELIPLENEEGFHSATSLLGIAVNWKRRAISTPVVFRNFVPSIGIVAMVSKRRDPVWTRDLQGNGCTLIKVMVNQNKGSFWFRDPEGHIQIREVAMSAWGHAGASNIRALKKELVTFEHAPFFFKNLIISEHSGYIWIDRPKIKGKALVECRAEIRLSALDQVCHKIREIQEFGIKMARAPMPLRKISEWYANEGYTLLGKDLNQMMSKIIRTLEERCKHKKILMHGDCNPGNFILNGEQIELIDWDWCCVVEFPGFDLFNLFWWGKDLPDNAHFIWDDQNINTNLNDMVVKNYFEQLHPGASWEMAVFAFWILRVSRGLGRVISGGFTPDWIKETALPIVLAIETLLSKKYP